MFLNRFFVRICAACVLVVVAAACGGGSDAVSDYGFDRAVYHPRHSGGFAVDGRSDGGASLMLTVHTPWQGADSVADARRLLLLAPGEDIPAGYTGQVVDGCARRIVAMSTTQIAMLATADSADIWVNTGTATTMAELLAMAPRLAGTKPVVSGRVFNNTRRMQPGGGNDYFESGTVRPDVVLADLFSIFHPGAAVADPDSLYYYLRLQ